MRRFVYFIAGLSGSPGHDDLARLGLRHAFPRNVRVETRNEFGHPGGAGLLIAAGEGDLVYDSKTQIWTKVSETVWLGMPADVSQRPGPEDLQRLRRCTEGRQIVLADHNAWTIPVIRFANGNTNLPRVLKLSNGKGDGEYIIKEEFQALFNVAKKIVDDSVRGDGSRYGPADLMWFGTEALRVNYRVTAAEVSALELLDSENIIEVANAAIDGDTLVKLMEELKKKLRETSADGLASQTGGAA